jgi:hypothetical protein
MKRIVALVVLAVVGFAAAGCAAGHKAASNVITLTSIVDVKGQPQKFIVSGTATIPHVAPGAEIACKGNESNWATVPAGLVDYSGKTYSVELSQGGRGSDGGRATRLQLVRSSNGTVTVKCSRG